MIKFTEHDNKLIREVPWSYEQRKVIADTLGSLVATVNSLAPDEPSHSVGITATPNPVELQGSAAATTQIEITADGSVLGAGSGADSAYTISYATAGDTAIKFDSTASYSGGNTFIAASASGGSVGNSASAVVTVVPNSSYASANPEIASSMADLHITPQFEIATTE